jgi:hypothetical protein
MRAYEFESSVDDKGYMKLPLQLIKLIPKNKNLRAMLFIEDEDNLWKGLVKEQFFAGYSDSDSIYDSEEK